MTRKKTHLEYENELFEAEVDCFPLEQYNGNKVPLKHICLKGHEWFAAPIYILRGNRCPECVGLKRKTTEQYQKQIKNRNYLVLEPYINTHTSIKHSCEKGHEWSAEPASILAGRGCPKCNSTLKTMKQYELELVNRDFKPIENYINNYTPILHECTKKHTWKASPSNILKGTGCPSCSETGFNLTKPAILYYVKIESNEEIYYKIGVTNRTVDKRLNLDTDKNIQIISIWNYDFGQEAVDKEQKLFAMYKKDRKHIPGFLKSGGNTELFEFDILELDK